MTDANCHLLVVSYAIGLILGIWIAAGLILYLTRRNPPTGGLMP